MQIAIVLDRLIDLDVAVADSSNGRPNPSFAKKRLSADRNTFKSLFVDSSLMPCSASPSNHPAKRSNLSSVTNSGS